MKSLESRIKKLEEQLKADNQNEKIVMVLHFHDSPWAKKYHMKCPHLEDEKTYGECPLYEERYQEAKQRNQPGFLTFTLPCFKEGECPLCLGKRPTTLTGKSRSRDEN